MSYIDNHQEQAFDRVITQYKFDVPTIVPPPTDLQFLGVGHSYITGVISGTGVVGNSYRREMYYRWRTHYKMNYTFVGSFSSGDIPTPYHNGVSGEDSAGLNAAINGYLSAAFAVPTTSDCVLVGPIDFADCLNSVPLATYKANIDSIINKIHAHSPLIKIFLITGPEVPFAFPPGQYLVDYVNEMKKSYADALAAGKNIYLSDLHSQSINIGPDDIHPDWLGYEQTGEFLTDDIAVALDIPEKDRLTLFSDTFTDTNGVFLKDHSPDINYTGNVWLDPNNRFEINTNFAKGISGGGYDAVVDINSVVYEAQIKMFQSVTTRTYFLIKSDNTFASRMYLFINQAAGKLSIQTSGGLYAEYDFSSLLNTWYTFNITIRGNSIRITDVSDVEIMHVNLASPWNNYAHVGLACSLPAVCYLDDLLIKI